MFDRRGIALITTQITTVEKIVDEDAAKDLGVQEGALYLLGAFRSSLKVF